MKRVIALFLSLSFIFALIPAMTLSVSAGNPTYNVNDPETWPYILFTSQTPFELTLSSYNLYCSTASDYASGWASCKDATVNAESSGSNYFIRLRGNNANVGWPISISGTNVSVSGNIMALLDYNNLSANSVSDYCFEYLFQNCTALVSATDLILPATNLDEYCYKDMFNGCSLLVAGPEKLPAKILKNNCYQQMFFACSSLIAAPEIYATNAAQDSCNLMFGQCTSMLTPPTKLAATVSRACYNEMFSGCSSLINGPELPALNMAENCYYRMFENCTSLTDAPQLLATNLADSCYSEMFKNCVSLKNITPLPAMTLQPFCYSWMFYGCKSIVSTPVLPATTLAQSCYSRMFYNCTSLTNAPELPATTFAGSCYSNMFAGCTSLEITTDTNHSADFNGVWNFSENVYDSSYWAYTLDNMITGTKCTPSNIVDTSKNNSPFTGTDYYFKLTTESPYTGSNNSTTPEAVEEHEEPDAEVEIGGMDLKLEYGNDTVVLNKEAYEKTKDSGENAGSKNYRLDFRDASVDVLEAIVPKDVVQDLAKQGKGIEFENRHGFMVIEELDDTTNNSVVIGVKDDVASHSQIKALGTTHVEAEFNIAYKTNGREIEGDATVYIPCDIANPRLFYVIDDNTMGELPCRVSGGYCVFDRYLDGTYVVCK